MTVIKLGGTPEKAMLTAKEALMEPIDIHESVHLEGPNVWSQKITERIDSVIV